VGGQSQNIKNKYSTINNNNSFLSCFNDSTCQWGHDPLALPPATPQLIISTNVLFILNFVLNWVRSYVGWIVIIKNVIYLNDLMENKPRSKQLIYLHYIYFNIMIWEDFPEVLEITNDKILAPILKQRAQTWLVF